MLCMELRLRMQAITWHGQGLSKCHFTVFVDNLPASMSKSWLWQLFSYEGKVVDIFLSQKKRKNSKQPFAFVRFVKRDEANLAIKNLHKTEIKGCKIKVSLAKFKRSSARESAHVDKKFLTTNPIPVLVQVAPHAMSYKDAVTNSS